MRLTAFGNLRLMQREAKRVRVLETDLKDLRTALQAAGNKQEELEKTKQDLDDLRQISGSYIQELNQLRLTLKRGLKPPRVE